METSEGEPVSRYITLTLTEDEIINLEIVVENYRIDIPSKRIETQFQRTIAKMKAARLPQPSTIKHHCA